MLVDDNYRVKQGDLLVVLDKEPYQIQVALKKAAVATAKANAEVAEDQVRGIVAQARSNRYRLEHAMEDVRDQLAPLKSQFAQLDVEKANQVLAEQDFARSESLVGKGAVSKQQYDHDKAALDVAKNRVTAAMQNIQQTRANLGLSANIENPLDVPPDLDQNFSTVRQALGDLLASVAPLGVHPSSYNLTPNQIIDEFYRRDPERNLDRIFAKLIADAPAIQEAKARLELAQADLDQAELNLRYCDVYAEISGVITRRNVNPGNNVQAGQSADGDPIADRNLDRRQFQGDPVGQFADRPARRAGRRHVRPAACLRGPDHRFHDGDRLDLGAVAGAKRHRQFYQGRPAPAGAHRADQLRPRQGAALHRFVGRPLCLHPRAAGRAPCRRHLAAGLHAGAERKAGR